tara:strand:- start:251 stop:1015 length:765 start_codon:yes stop_codon:yes gene_type:complete
MRPRFEKGLQAYSELAKDTLDTEKSPDEEQELANAINWKTKRVARDSGSSPRAQSAIFDIQKNKQELMQSLKQKIADLDNPETTAERKEGQVLIMYNQGTEKFYQVEKGMEPISVGEIMTDGDWGIEYYLDPETIPRNIRKRYIIESAKNRIQSKLDEQIIIDEISNQKTDKFKRETYGRIKADAEKGYDPTGIIAEKMVKNFLKKLTYDSDVNFRLIEADVFQDVEQKVDFIIHRKKHTRGVGVDENDQSGDI